MPASKDELTAAMHRIYDALRFMRGPNGDLIFLGEKSLHMAWHLARAGADVHPERAVIKAVPVRDRPGQFSGMVDWAPVDWEDTRGLPDPPSATAPDIDLDTLDDLVPFHTKTHIEGAFK